MEQIPKNSPLSKYISVHPGRMSGAPVFKGTRVPIVVLFDNLRNGRDIEFFLDQYPGVTRRQVLGVLDLAARGVVGAAFVRTAA